MIKFHCQPEFYTDRSDNWEIVAPDARKAAEMFQAIYDAEHGHQAGVPSVRVIYPDGKEQLFEVRSVEVREYTAEEK